MGVKISVYRIGQSYLIIAISDGVLTIVSVSPTAVCVRRVTLFMFREAGVAHARTRARRRQLRISMTACTSMRPGPADRHGADACRVTVSLLRADCEHDRRHGSTQNGPARRARDMHMTHAHAHAHAHGSTQNGPARRARRARGRRHSRQRCCRESWIPSRHQ